MAKSTYIGIGNVARKVKKMYVGINGVARKVKKAYIGIGGVARLFFSGGELEYVGTATALSQGRGYLAATTVGNYALFGGGAINGRLAMLITQYATVDAYNNSLTRSTPTALSKERWALAATTVGNYALFGGGVIDSANKKLSMSTVDAYNTSLTRSTPTSLSKERQLLASTTVGDYALFGGGGYSYLTANMFTATEDATVDAYNTSLTRSTPTALSKARYSLSATTIGNYALFGGGNIGSTTVDAYNASLTRSTPTALSSGAGADGAATTVGNYAVFGTNIVVEAYNTSLTKSTITALSMARWALSATTVGEYALFGGGTPDNKYQTNTVDAYDTSLTRSTPTALSVARATLASTTVGNYALFGGGVFWQNNGYDTGYPTVDVYTAG